MDKQQKIRTAADLVDRHHRQWPKAGRDLSTDTARAVNDALAAGATHDDIIAARKDKL